jgi:hypothetical protein
MRTILSSCLFALTLVSGCTEPNTSDVSQRDDVNNGEDCQCKVEGADIGRVGASVKPPGHTSIRFASWIEKAGSPGEYIGFTLWGDYGDATYVVKAGTETFTVTGAGTWMHPAGSSGPNAHGISNVDFCPDEPTEDGPPID